MGSLDNPKPWVPYMNTKDCSQGFCSLYCPQWCHLIIPPPPTYSSFSSSSSSSSTNNSVPGPSFSPLVIAIIGILASALLLVSYYAIISKYCGNMESSVNNRTIQDQTMAPNEEELEDNGEQLGYWMNTTATGLDEALIKSITLCKYKKSDGLIDSTDCSVCLAEFEDDEELRLLPKCGHAFHVECIDTWLKSHTNCPLCRANVALSAFNNDRRQQPSFQPPLPPLVPVPPHPPLPERDSDDLGNRHQQQHNETGHDPEDELMIHLGDHASGSRNERVCENRFRALSDLGDSGLRHTIIDVRDGSCSHSNTAVRRSASMDTTHQLRRLSIADILHYLHANQGEENYQMEEELCQLHGQIGYSKGLTQLGESSKSSSSSSSSSSSRNKVLHCVKNSVAMKRSFWIERSFSVRYGRKRVNAILPV